MFIIKVNDYTWKLCAPNDTEAVLNAENFVEFEADEFTQYNMFKILKEELASFYPDDDPRLIYWNIGNDGDTYVRRKSPVLSSDQSFAVKTNSEVKELLNLGVLIHDYQFHGTEIGHNTVYTVYENGIYNDRSNSLLCANPEGYAIALKSIQGTKKRIANAKLRKEQKHNALSPAHKLHYDDIYKTKFINNIARASECLSIDHLKKPLNIVHTYGSIYSFMRGDGKLTLATAKTHLKSKSFKLCMKHAYDFLYAASEQWKLRDHFKKSKKDDNTFYGMYHSHEITIITTVNDFIKEYNLLFKRNQIDELILEDSTQNG